MSRLIAKAGFETNPYESRESAEQLVRQQYGARLFVGAVAVVAAMSAYFVTNNDHLAVLGLVYAIHTFGTCDPKAID